MINSLDTILRGSPDRGVILSGDFNQFNDTFVRRYYGYEQVVKADTRNVAILGEMRSIVSPVYGLPSVIDELGTSDHKMVLLVPERYPTFDTGMVQKIVTRRMGKTERALFTGTDQMAVFAYTTNVRGTVYVFPRNCGPFIG